ncbi:MAG TPA: cytochrome P450 [Acetobacteraceae bacterium]|nr:cytochrome P450 [Acetobacteraceae bacterium]
MSHIPPRPPLPTRLRSQAEAFLVLRRNPLELWGAPAYELDIAEGSFLGRKQLLLNAPEAIRHVLVSNAANYRRNPATRRILAPIIGDGLFLAEGEAWRHQRRTIAPALAPRAMPMLARHVMNAAMAAESSLRRLAYRPIILLPHLQALALAIAGQSMFSLEMKQHATELRTLITEYGRNYAQPDIFDLLFGGRIAGSVERGRASFRVRWLAFLDRLIEARRTQPPGGERDLFDLLDAARDPETGEAFSHAQLRDEVSTMILAGHETTAVTLFWSLYLAALYPEVGRDLAMEARAADLDRDPAEALAHLPRIRAHVDEALRLYPPAFLMTREAVADGQILGRPVAAGTVVVISPWVLHRHRRLWRAPDMYDPARFLPGAAPPERFAYLPFGAGPRICVGMNFALTEAVLVLARLLRGFRIELCAPGTVLPRGIVTTQPDREVRFLLAPA